MPLKGGGGAILYSGFINQDCTGLKISVGHGRLSDPLVKLSDVKRKAPGILSDRSKIEDFCPIQMY